MPSITTALVLAAVHAGACFSYRLGPRRTLVLREPPRRAILILQQDEESLSYDTNALVLAARKGKVEALSELLSQPSVEIDLAVRCDKVPTMDGASALVWAARQGQLEAASLKQPA